MSKKRNTFRIVGGLLFVIGIVFGFTLSSLIIWGDLEASLFTSGLRAEESLAIRCPVIITASETGTISTILKNPTEKSLERYLIASISEGYASLVREIRTDLAIQPKDKEKVEWKIYPEDAAFNQRVVLFRVYINPRYPYPSLGANCGVVRVNVQGLSGNQIFAGAVALSLISLGAGATLLETGGRPYIGRARTTRNNTFALAGVVLAAGAVGYLGLWVPALALLAISVLLLGVLVSRLLAAAE